MASGAATADASAPFVFRRVPPEEVRAMDFDPVDDTTRGQAQRIIDEVRSGGEAGLLSVATRFGDIKEGAPYVLERDDLKAVFDSLPESQRALLERVAARVRRFAEAQRSAISDVTVDVPGGTAGHWVTPVDTAGCYAPGGRYPLPSSVLMTAITARVAGVRRVWVASPRPAPITVGAAYVAGADALLAVGGAQAIAAMAYGVGRVPACDVIVGPGNRWVTAAKSIVSGRCGIDMLAGPSECLVLADDTADATTIAADLLAQAEHDTDALPILVTTSEALVGRVEAAVAAELATLQTAATAAISSRKGYAVVCPTLESAIAVSDAIAPEHLEIMVADNDAVARRVNHFGGIFIGPHTAEVFGDYGIGPNHVLPTGGTGRYTGGLSVFTFLRVRTWLRSTDLAALDADGGAGRVAYEEVVRDTAALARLEGLHGHERAALCRSADPTLLAAAVEEGRAALEATKDA